MKRRMSAGFHRSNDERSDRPGVGGGDGPPPAAAPLSPMASEAISDLERLLRLLDKRSLDAGAFSQLLRSIGYDGDCDAIFDELTLLCSSASNRNVDELDSDALRALYGNSPAYATCADRRKSGRALTGAIVKLFVESLDEEEEGTPDVAFNDSLSSEETAPPPSSPSCVVSLPKSFRRSSLRTSITSSTTSTSAGTSASRGLGRRGTFRLLRQLSATSLASSKGGGGDDDESFAARVCVFSEEDIARATDRLFRKHRGGKRGEGRRGGGGGGGGGGSDDDDDDDDEEEDLMTVEKLTASLLRYDPAKVRRDGRAKILGLSDVLFDPAHVSSARFAAALEEAVCEHGALNHHLLDSLSRGSFGEVRTVEVVAHYMQAYKHFTSNFTALLERCVSLCGEADPGFAEILEENLEEEQGIYDEETLEEIEAAGLDASKLNRLPHKQLYDECLRSLSRASMARPLTDEDVERIGTPLVEAFEAGANESAATSIAALYFGSEFIVSNLYAKLSRSLHRSDRLTRQDLAFFILHIDMDVEHAAKMKEIVISLADTEADRRAMAARVEDILDARVEFYDRLVEAAIDPPANQQRDDGAAIELSPSGDSSSSSIGIDFDWDELEVARREETDGAARSSGGAASLLDSNGRPVVFGMCRPLVRGSHVLDLGCGDGRGARTLLGMGAASLVGIDADEAMIDRAWRLAAGSSSSSRESYVAADAEKLMEALCDRPAEVGIVPGVAIKEGMFDLATAIFLFNDTSITKMKKIIAQVFRALKPGGTFIFSVPHPFLINGAQDDTEEGPHTRRRHSLSTLETGDASFSDSFSSLRDRKIEGVVRFTDGGTDMNARASLKSMSDYDKAVHDAGFSMVRMLEARAASAADALGRDPERRRFESAIDSPLHFVYEVKKPADFAEAVRIPKKRLWSGYEHAFTDKVLGMDLPQDVSVELDSLVVDLVERGVTADTYNPSDKDMARLPNTAAFAAAVRRRILHCSGAAHVRGLSMAKYALKGVEANNPDVPYQCAKLAYFILCRLVGKVDGGARGRLFDVRDSELDASDDNVLFSVSRGAAPWHTDGASVDRHYDVASLLCISPAAEGGAFRISNACNAFEKLKSRLPKFLFYELLRAIPRDVLENGRGRGVNDLFMRFSRSPELLQLRVQHNSYPIFVEGSDGNRMQFRYMRHWIETGHAKAYLTLSPLLKVAMDMLDAALDEEKVFDARLQQGEMVFCNNLLFAHARDAFVDGTGAHKRHMVRAWIQVQEIDRDLQMMGS